MCDINTLWIAYHQNDHNIKSHNDTKKFIFIIIIKYFKICNKI